jgi:hypothetical protein
MGIGTVNEVQRALARCGVLKGVDPTFGNHNSIAYGGVLFLLPALMSQGLMTIKQTHSIKEGYYKLESIILTLAFMALCRIKNPEQLKQCAPGEMGKLIGLDRIPEIKCLRQKMKELFANKNTKLLNEKLAVDWIQTEQSEESDNLFLYTDGHVKIYNGSKAILTKKFISRQKLCLAATADFWLNDEQGLPLLVWTGELSEKLQHVIEKQIIPQLLSSGALKKHIDSNSETPICTLVFDREAYEPAFFMRLWNDYRIAIITYRKNVKDKWSESDFIETPVMTDLGNTKTMLLCEKPITLNGQKFREIRCLATREHQTALITTHPTLPMAIVAPKLFNRWKQENFFKYMIADYSLDHLVEYGTEPINQESTIVNPAYRSMCQQIKKEKEKLQRLKATLLKGIRLNTESQLEEFKTKVESKSDLVEQIQTKDELIRNLQLLKKDISKRLTLADMPEQNRINKLKTESAYFMNTLKMICYRAESSLSNVLHGVYGRYNDEKRMFIKNLINTPADIIENKKEQTLTVILHSSNTPKNNTLIEQICAILNDTDTIYPGTNLRLHYKTIAS